MEGIASHPVGGKTPLGDDPLFDGALQEMAESTYAWIQPNGGLGESNAGLICGADASILVDTLWDEVLTRRMLDAMAPARDGRPIDAIFNTHGDGDHWYGNGLLGGPTIHATEAAKAHMEDEPPSVLQRMRPVPKLAAAGGAVPLMPGGDKLRGLAHFGEMLSNYEFANLDPRLPNRTFTGKASIEVGGRTLELIEVGPAHSPGDAIGWLADVRTVFSGDIVFSGVTPIMWAGPVENWIAALERIIELNPETIVPGHGPVCGLERVEELHAYWTYLARMVPEGTSGSVEELARELICAAEYRTSPWGDWLNPERSYVNIAIIARELDNGGGPLSVPAKLKLISGMGAMRDYLISLGARPSPPPG